MQTIGAILQLEKDRKAARKQKKEKKIEAVTKPASVLPKEGKVTKSKKAKGTTINRVSKTEQQHETTKSKEQWNDWSLATFSGNEVQQSVRLPLLL